MEDEKSINALHEPAIADEHDSAAEADYQHHAESSPEAGEDLEIEDAQIPNEEEDALEQDEAVAPEEIHSEPDLDAEDGVHGTEHESELAEPLPEAAEPVAPASEAAVAKHWYIIHAYSGFEQKVAESLKSRAQAFGFADRLGQILIPTEEVVELRNGKKVTSKRLLYPGYVLVEMEMDDELWHAVKSTPRVTGFVGGGVKPVPLTADEVNAVLYRQASSAERPRPRMTFEKNETVKIIDGPFTNFSGKVDEINSERNTLRVLVTIFGRSTPVELDFLQVEKI
jgi:transcription termination/antitermination protein NusG